MIAKMHWNFVRLLTIKVLTTFIFIDNLALGLTDYLTIIKTPMDLGTVKRKLKNNKYKYVEEVLEDI